MDHTFRINLLNDNIKIYTFDNHKIALFGTKLYRKNCNETPDNELYVVLLPNLHSQKQKWYMSKGIILYYMYIYIYVV